MIERGEAKGEVMEDKYFVIFEDDLENREVTRKEAIKLGIIEEDMEEEVNEEVEMLTEEEVGEPIEIVTEVKSEKTKMPFYVSMVGLVTVLVGGFAYVLQWRRK